MGNSVCIFSPLPLPERTTFATDPICIWRIDVHRLGRTARAGKEGLGLLVLDPMELPFVTSKGMKELPLEETSEDDLLGQPGAKAWEAKIEWATESVDPEVRASSYRVGRFYPTKSSTRKRLCLPTGMAWFLFNVHALIANQGRFERRTRRKCVQRGSSAIRSTKSTAEPPDLRAEDAGEDGPES